MLVPHGGPGRVIGVLLSGSRCRGRSPVGHRCWPGRSGRVGRVHLVDPATGNGLSIAFFDDDVDVAEVKAAITKKADGSAGTTSFVHSKSETNSEWRGRGTRTPTLGRATPGAHPLAVMMTRAAGPPTGRTTMLSRETLARWFRTLSRLATGCTRARAILRRSPTGTTSGRRATTTTWPRGPTRLPRWWRRPSSPGIPRPARRSTWGAAPDSSAERFAHEDSRDRSSGSTSRKRLSRSPSSPERMTRSRAPTSSSDSASRTTASMQSSVWG